MSVHACEDGCEQECVSMCARECMCREVGVLCVCICIPPSPEAVLCIVVGMAYMLTQAWFSVVQYTRLPIHTALPCRVRGPASFTFAPELMLVNCHINSDLLARFVNNVKQPRCAIAAVIFALIHSARMD